MKNENIFDIAGKALIKRLKGRVILKYTKSEKIFFGIGTDKIYVVKVQAIFR